MTSIFAIVVLCTPFWWALYYLSLVFETLKSRFARAHCEQNQISLGQDKNFLSWFMTDSNSWHAKEKDRWNDWELAPISSVMSSQNQWSWWLSRLYGRPRTDCSTITYSGIFWDWCQARILATIVFYPNELKFADGETGPNYPNPNPNPTLHWYAPIFSINFTSPWMRRETHSDDIFERHNWDETPLTCQTATTTPWASPAARRYCSTQYAPFPLC
jgi:hypothetical protein